MLNLSVSTKNQLTGFSYDAAGNLIGDGSHTYQFDPENRLKALDNTGASYAYDADGLRIAQTTGSNTVEYLVVDGQTLAEHKGGDWTDYIFVEGHRIAKTDSFQDRIHINGNNCSNCGSQYSLFAFPTAAGYSSYVIRTGDKLFLQQWQSSGAHGGMQLAFSDGTNTNWSVTDQDGNQLNNDGTQQAWHNRRVDLSQYAGKAISQIYLAQESTTTAGAWDIYFEDVALFSTDGTVRPIYTRETNISLSMSGSSGVSGRTYEVNHWSGLTSPDTTTNYYHSDHLGSSRMMSSANGYPVWQAVYLPFGYEYNPQVGVNRNKFATYQRDSESGLDYAKFRYYNSTIGRFMSPDPVGGSILFPQTWNRYSYAANNPLNFNDPLGLRCSWEDGTSDDTVEDGGADAVECRDQGGSWGERRAFE